MQPPASGQPHGMGGGKRGVAFRQQPAGMPNRQILLIALGADADPLAEHPLEMRRAHPHLACKILQRQGGAARIDGLKRPGDHLVMIGRGLVGHGHSSGRRVVRLRLLLASASASEE
jgi:hypothetical protein